MAKNKHRAKTMTAASVIAETDQARKAFKSSDSFVNTGARVGFGAGSQQDTSHFHTDFVSRNRVGMEAAYRSNWLCGMVVDVVAEDMTRAGVEFQSEDLPPDDAAKLHQAMTRLRIWDALCANIKWSRLYGGSIAVMLIDGQKLDTPLRAETIGRDQFKGLFVLDRWQIQPTLHRTVQEIGPNLGAPEFYDVLPGAAGLQGQKIHYSRVIRLDGLELPHWQRLAENGWGQSVLERLWDRVIAFDSTTQGAAQLVYKAHLRVIKVKGLRDLLAAGGSARKGFDAMMDDIRQRQSNEGLTVLDVQDEFETTSYTFAGLDSVLLQFAQQLSGATQIPLVRLFGQSPAGLNSTGESDVRTYFDGINQKQEAKLRPGVATMLAVLARSELGRELPEGFDFGFASLWQMTNAEKATVAKTVTEAVTSAEESGLISQQTALKELRQSSRTTGIFSHISDDDINEAEEKPPAPGELDEGALGPDGGPKLRAVE
jgi:phage-related protein (TIGR01555 family)